GGKQGGNRPPKAKSKFQNEPGHAGVLTNPLESVRDGGRGGDAESPGHRAHVPEKAALGFAFAQFLRAQLYAELCARGETAREGDGHAAQDAEGVAGLLRDWGAGGALAEMSGEPVALGLGESFNALLRD